MYQIRVPLESGETLSLYSTDAIIGTITRSNKCTLLIEGLGPLDLACSMDEFETLMDEFYDESAQEMEERFGFSFRSKPKGEVVQLHPKD